MNLTEESYKDIGKLEKVLSISYLFSIILFIIHLFIISDKKLDLIVDNSIRYFEVFVALAIFALSIILCALVAIYGMLLLIGFHERLKRGLGYLISSIIFLVLAGIYTLFLTSFVINVDNISIITDVIMIIQIILYVSLLVVKVVTMIAKNNIIK